MPIPAPLSPPLLRAMGALAADRSGAVTVTIALTFTVLVGFAALGTEVAEWYSIRRTMQGAADSAAYSGAMAKWSGASTTYTSEAQSVAGSYGFVDGTNNAVVTVNSPPASGNHTTDSNAVEVIVSRPQPLQLARMFLSAPPTLTARAVATMNPSGSACIMALDRGNVTDLSDNGNTTLNLPGCNLYINSPSSSALTLTGQATINANAAYIAGNYTTSGRASLNTTSGTFTGAAAANDPYADVSIPSYSGCDQNNYSINGNKSASFAPGSSGVMVFCNGLSLSGGSSVTLAAGTYIIDRGSLSISGNSSISGTAGVTIILTSSTGSNYATASVSGGSTVDLVAPTSGPLAGMAVFQDRNAPASGTDSFSGGTSQNITGVVYFPNQSVTFSGGTTTGGAICTQLVASIITFNGNAAFNNNCQGTGVRAVAGSFIQLVE
jgi:Flp pilus assembly protein TadG